MVHGLRGEASCHILMFHLLTRRPPAHVLRCTNLLSDEVHETSRVADRRARREAPQGRRGMTGADAHQFSWAAARGRKVDLTSDCCYDNHTLYTHEKMPKTCKPCLQGLKAPEKTHARSEGSACAL